MQEAFSDFNEADEEQDFSLDSHSGHFSQDTSCPVFRGQQYRFFEGNLFARIKSKNSKTYLPVDNLWPNQDHLAKFLGTCFSACYKSHVPQSVPVFTQVVHKSERYYAHPTYQGGNSWHDWALVKWDGYEHDLPTRLLLIIEFPSQNFSPFSVEDMCVHKPGMYVVGHSLTCDPRYIPPPGDNDDVEDWNGPVHPWSTLLFQANVEYDESEMPIYSIFSVENITGPCVVYPLDYTGDFVPHTFVVLPPREEWADIFSQHFIQKSLQQGQVLPTDFVEKEVQEESDAEE